MRVQELGDIALFSLHGFFSSSVKDSTRVLFLQSFHNFPFIPLEPLCGIGKNPQINIRKLVPRKGIPGPFKKPVRFISNRIDKRHPGEMVDVRFLQNRQLSDKEMTKAQDELIRDIEEENSEPGHPKKTHKPRLSRNHQGRQNKPDRRNRDEHTPS